MMHESDTSHDSTDHEMSIVDDHENGTTKFLGPETEKTIPKVPNMSPNKFLKNRYQFNLFCKERGLPGLSSTQGLLQLLRPKKKRYVSRCFFVVLRK